MRWLTLACILSASGCNVVAGLGDFEDAVPTGGAAGDGGTGGATSGASGGAGEGGVGPGGGGAGGRATIPAVDWTASFDAVYRFENGQALGMDASGHGRDLTTSERASFDDTNAAEGAASVALDGGGLSSVDGSFAPGYPFTFGAWIRRTGNASLGTEAPVARFLVTDTIGYRIHRGGAGRVSCAHGNGNGVERAVSLPTHVVSNDTWIHIVCRATDGQMELFWGGDLDGSTATTPAVSASSDPPFEVGSSDMPWPGNVDEVFFVHANLTDAHVARIHACGIDGSLCTCDASAPETYASCGRAPSCTALEADVPCNAAQP